MGPRIVACGAIKGRQGSGGSACSPALIALRRHEGPGWQHDGRLNQCWGLGIPNPRCCSARSLGRGPLAADLGLGLGPRCPAGPIRQLCG